MAVLLPEAGSSDWLSIVAVLVTVPLLVADAFTVSCTEVDAPLASAVIPHFTVPV